MMIEPSETTACPLCGSQDAEPLLESATQMHGPRRSFRFVRCRRCALIRLDPRVPLDGLDAYYGPAYLPHRGPSAWGRWAAVAGEGQRRTDAARVRLARQAVRLGPGSEVLDVGCGRPTFLEALIRATGARATGLDASEAGWAGEPERWARAGIALRRGLAQDLDPEQRYDLVCLWHTLEHDYTPLDTLRRLRAVTRPGGALLVEVPDYDSLTRRLQGSRWAGYHTPRHATVYTAATLRAMLERAGWTVERQTAYGTLDPYVLWWLGRQERKGRSLAGNLERAFPGFLLGKLATLPVAMARRWVRLGVQGAQARP